MTFGSVPTVTLASKQSHRCLSGHPWVFRSELSGLEGLTNGAEVRLEDHRKRFIGKGFYSAQSQISVRLASRLDEPLDAAFLRRRLVAAIAARTSKPARRLVSSEADLLPGLIVDQYRDRLVVQSTTVGMDQRQDICVAILDELLHPTQIIERNDLAVRALEGLPQRAGVLRGPAQTILTVPIGRLETTLDLLDPHKTGTYLDQQQAHEDFARWVKPGERILDICCHLGGFALHGLLAGAREAVAVDQAAASIAGCTAAANRAGVGERLTAVCADAFAWLKDADERREQFDVVVLDPPSFTRNRAGVSAALRGYHDLHLRGLRRLRPGGRLLTFSCSHHIGRDDFLANVVEAAADAKRTVRLDAVLGASPDHPVLPAVPETEYLKGFVLTVLEN
jgi:23S rRNA (cytosine1962-C5)-methyltransferase